MQGDLAESILQALEPWAMDKNRSDCCLQAVGPPESRAPYAELWLQPVSHEDPYVC